MSNQNKMKKAKRERTTIYGYEDFFGDRPTQNNRLTGHHIDPIRWGGKITMYNIALAIETNHLKLNEVEKYLPHIALVINNNFKSYLFTGAKKYKKENKELLETSYEVVKVLIKK